jgi:hypothetical protein
MPLVWSVQAYIFVILYTIIIIILQKFTKFYW